MGFFLIALSVFTNIAEGMLVKIQGSKSSRGVYIFNGLIAVGSMLFFVFTDTDGFSLSAELFSYAVPSAIMYCMALICTYKALACGSFALSMLIISYSIVFPVVYGIVFLKEPAGILTYIAFAIIAVSLYLSRGNTAGEKKEFSVKWVIYILIATIGNGLFSVMKKMQQIRFDNALNNEFMIITLGTSAVFLLAFGFAKDGAKSISLKGTACAVGAGLFNGVTNMLTLIINTMVALSISQPITTGLRIVLSFVISGLILKERFLKRQIGGVILGAAALILLNI